MRLVNIIIFGTLAIAGVFLIAVQAILHLVDGAVSVAVQVGMHLLLR